MPKAEPARLPVRVQRKKAKGKTYYYFVAGTSSTGKTMLKRLPDIRDIEFSPAYAAMMHAFGRTKPNVKAPLTATELANRWEKSADFMENKPKTRRVYSMYLPVFLEQFGHAPANEVAQVDIRALKESMADRTGAANMTLSVISSLYNWGREQSLVTVTPTKDVKPYKTTDHKEWPDKLLAEALADDDWLVRTSVALMFYTAQRIGDVADMRWSKDDDAPCYLHEGRVFVKQEKTGTELDFPIHPKLAAILGEPKESGFVLAYRAKGYAANTIRARIQAWGLARGHKIVPHGLRKNAVNKLLEVGCSVAQTSAVSGQSLKVVEHYSKRRNRSTLGSSAMLIWSENEK
jgi:integrase